MNFRLLGFAVGRDWARPDGPILRIGNLVASSLYERLGDLLLTDVVMLEMGGKHLAEALVARDAALKVLFVSGWIGVRRFCRSRSRRAGCSAGCGRCSTGVRCSCNSAHTDGHRATVRLDARAGDTRRAELGGPLESDVNESSSQLRRLLGLVH